MNILDTYSANILVAQDYRMGTFEDQYGTTVTKTGNAVLNNKHFVLDGASDVDYGQIENGALDGLTIMAKISPKESGTLQRFLTRYAGSGTVAGMISFDITGDKIRIAIANNVPAFEVFSSTATIDIGVDTIVTVVFNAGSVKLYINNVLYNSSSFSLSEIPAYTQNWICWSDGDDVENFEGTSDYIYALNVALTDTERFQLTDELENKPIPKKVIGRVKATAGAVYGDDSSNTSLAYGDILDLGTSDLEVSAKISIPLGYKVNSSWVSLIGKPYVGTVDGRYYFGITSADKFFVILEGAALATFTITDTNTVDYYGTDELDVLWIIDRSGNMSLSINGTSLGTVNVSAISGESLNTAQPFQISGATGGATKKNFSGSIREVEVKFDGTRVAYFPFANSYTETVNTIEPASTANHSLNTVKFKDVDFKTDFGALSNQRSVTSGLIENTPFSVMSGSFKIVDDTYNGKTVKAIECINPGAFSIPTSYFQQDSTNSAYGTWEIVMEKDDDSDRMSFGFVNELNEVPSGGSLDYRIQLETSTALLLFAGGGSLFSTATSYIAANVKYGIKIIRTVTGEFTVYIKGGAFGNDYALIDVSGGSGTNPVTDNIKTTSNYMVFYSYAGCKFILGNIVGDYGITKK